MNKTAQYIIDIQNVSKRFGEKTALHGINLFVRKGEFMTILGPSGCGKTTLLRLLAGFETATEGIITISVLPESLPRLGAALLQSVVG